MPARKKVKKRRYRLLVLTNIDEYRAIKRLAREAKRPCGPWMRETLLKLVATPEVTNEVI